MTDFYVNVGDVWKKVSEAHVNVSDTWKKVTKGYVNVGDTWKLFYDAVTWTPPTVFTDISYVASQGFPNLNTPVYCATNNDIWFRVTANSQWVYFLVGAVGSDFTAQGSGWSVTVYDNSGNIVAGPSSGGQSMLEIGTSSATSGSYYWLKFSSGSTQAHYVAATVTTGLTTGGLYVSPLGSSTYVSSSVTGGQKYYTCCMGNSGAFVNIILSSSNASYGYYWLGYNGWNYSNQAYPTGSFTSYGVNTSSATPPWIVWAYFEPTQSGTFPMYMK